VQVVVGDAAIPVGAARRAGQVVLGLQPEGDGAARQQGAAQVGVGQMHLAAAEVIQLQRQAVARVGKDDALQEAPQQRP